MCLQKFIYITVSMITVSKMTLTMALVTGTSAYFLRWRTECNGIAAVEPAAIFNQNTSWI